MFLVEEVVGGNSESGEGTSAVNVNSSLYAEAVGATEDKYGYF